MNDSTTTPGRIIGHRAGGAFYGYGPTTIPDRHTNTASGWQLAGSDQLTASQTTRRALRVIALSALALAEVWRDLH